MIQIPTISKFMSYKTREHTAKTPRQNIVENWMDKEKVNLNFQTYSTLHWYVYKPLKLKTICATYKKFPFFIKKNVTTERIVQSKRIRHSRMKIANRRKSHIIEHANLSACLTSTKTKHIHKKPENFRQSHCSHSNHSMRNVCSEIDKIQMQLRPKNIALLFISNCQSI